MAQTGFVMRLWPGSNGQGAPELPDQNNQNDGETSFEIYTITGQLIHSEKAVSGAKTTIKTNGWASGVYLMKATNNGNKTTKKIIIQ